MKVALSAFALLLAFAPPTEAADRWTRLQSKHFLVVGNTSERRMRLVAESLEQFHHVVSRALTPAMAEPPRQTVVFVFDAERSFKPYRPRYGGRPLDVVGFFQPSPDADYIAINAGFEQQALRIVFHEYAHALTRNALGDVPLWASEGLAGVYETFEGRSGGRAGTIGIPRMDHVGLLAGGALMPLADLLAVDHSSPVYNEGQRRGMFYAQSWALMHYLMLGSRTRATELATYMAEMKAGAPSDRAFTAAFGSNLDALERELKDYVRLGRFSDKGLQADEPLERVQGRRTETMDRGEVTNLLGDLLTRVADADAARRNPRIAAPVPRAPGVRRDPQPVGTESGARPADSPDGGSSTESARDRGFRPLGPGELRVLGLISHVECGPGSVVLVVEAEDQNVRIGAPSLASVLLKSYDDTKPVAFECGAVLPPARVLATYREEQGPATMDGVDGLAVAVELLPQGDAR